jgi:hypothetical protein
VELGVRGRRTDLEGWGGDTGFDDKSCRGREEIRGGERGDGKWEGKGGDSRGRRGILGILVRPRASTTKVVEGGRR